MSGQFQKGLPKALCPNVSTSLCCGLCENILNTPMQSEQCGHRFCRGCVDEEKQKNVPFYCPACQKEGDNTPINLHEEGQIFVDRGVLRELYKLPVACIYCKNEMELKKWEEHLVTCPNKPVLCQQGCGELVSPSNLGMHLQTCPEGYEECSLCKQKVKRRELKIHSREACPSLFSECSNCGSRVFRNDLEMHQREDCPVPWNTRCPYGCTTINEPLWKHRQNEVATHVDRLMARTIQEEPSESLMSVIKELESSEICKLKAESVHLQDRLKAQEKLIGQMMMKITEQSLQIAACKEELRYLQSINYDGTLLWRIDGFSEKRSAAMDGNRPSVFSPPFFTSRNGYQMCARLYPNGDGLGQNSHLSLFFVLMKGPYDSLLKWPFQQKVTFLLKDQKGKADVVDAFRPDPSGESFRRPSSMMNIASGSPRFLPLSDLDDRNKGYVVDDVMFVRIIVDCSTLV